MRVLIVCSHRHYSASGIAPFVEEQVAGLRKAGIEVEYYIIRRKGLLGYLAERRFYLRKLHSFQPDVVHAHVGMSGLLANLQRQVPVVTTYHGSDINSHKGYLFSYWAIRLSRWNIFVSRKIYEKAGSPTNSSVIPCAVDTQLFYPRDMATCRAYFGMKDDCKYVLFSKAFNVPVKNYPLAKAAVDLLRDETMLPIKLVELKGYSREEVAMLMNACDCALMTSFNEGSPQFVKEALACGCPVVSTDVGDVSDVIDGIKDCHITSYVTADVSKKLYTCISSEPKKINTHEYIVSSFGEKRITGLLMNVYKKILN